MVTSERFSRWQGRAQDSLTSTQGLVLGLATGLLAFIGDQLLDGKLSGSCAPHLALLSASALAISVGLGVCCALLRLSDFRLTASIVRRRDGGESDSDLSTPRDKARRLGERSWFLFYWQLGAFGVGALTLAAAFVLAWARLCPAL